MSTPIVGATAHTTDPVRKRIEPIWKSFLRPTRSARRPKTTKSDPKRIEYAVTTHDTVPRLAVGKSAAISANATFTMERSNVEMYAATAVTMNVGHGLIVLSSVGVDT